MKRQIKRTAAIKAQKQRIKWLVRSSQGTLVAEKSVNKAERALERALKTKVYPDGSKGAFHRAWRIQLCTRRRDEAYDWLNYCRARLDVAELAMIRLYAADCPDWVDEDYGDEINHVQFDDAR